MDLNAAALRLASPTAAPLITGATTLITTGAAAISSGQTMAYTAVASIVGTSMLADLIKSIPGQRQANKADETLRRLWRDMVDLNARVNEWSDQQYQFVTTLVQNILAEGDDEKLEFLRRAALNAALTGAVVNVGGAFLARIIRDVTGPEVAYLLMNFGKQPLLPQPQLTDEKISDLAILVEKENMVLVESENDREVVTGLQVLGLLRNGSTRHAAQDLVWTNTAGKVLALVRPPHETSP